MNKADILPQIAATLKHGEFSGEKKKGIIIAYLALTIFMLLGMSGLVVYLSVEFANGESSTVEFVFTLIVVIFAFLFIITVVSYLVFRNERIRKEILLWLDDAVEVSGFARKIGDTGIDETIDWLVGRERFTKIQVVFKIDGKRYKRESVTKEFENPKGYSQIWNRYADREVRILYSPKYDQVMILKDK